MPGRAGVRTSPCAGPRLPRGPALRPPSRPGHAMTRHAQLDNIQHRHLRVDTTRSEALGDGVMLAPTFPDEFREIQAHYPIVFHRDGDGRIQPVALLGLQQGRNLFLGGGRWDAAYLPLAIERQPFLVGTGGQALNVHVDLDSPRLRTGRGEALFLEHGGVSGFLERMQAVLLALHDGLATVPVFVAALTTHALVEPFALDVRLDDGRRHRLDGFLTIDEQRVRALDAEAAGQLHADGHLEAIHMAMASVSRFRDLIDRMNRADDSAL